MNRFFTKTFFTFFFTFLFIIGFAFGVLVFTSSQMPAPIDNLAQPK